MNKRYEMMEKELTKGMKTKYLKKLGNECPFCGSDNITGGSFEADAGHAWQPIFCNECEKEWNDIYELVDVEETE